MDRQRLLCGPVAQLWAQGVAHGAGAERLPGGRRQVCCRRCLGSWQVLGLCSPPSGPSLEAAPLPLALALHQVLSFHTVFQNRLQTPRQNGAPAHRAVVHQRRPGTSNAGFEISPTNSELAWFHVDPLLPGSVRGPGRTPRQSARGTPAPLRPRGRSSWVRAQLRHGPPTGRSCLLSRSPLVPPRCQPRRLAENQTALNPKRLAATATAAPSHDPYKRRRNVSRASGKTTSPTLGKETRGGLKRPAA